jgi:hypothetical protein
MLDGPLSDAARLSERSAGPKERKRIGYAPTRHVWAGWRCIWMVDLSGFSPRELIEVLEERTSKVVANTMVYLALAALFVALVSYL